MHLWMILKSWGLPGMGRHGFFIPMAVKLHGYQVLASLACHPARDKHTVLQASPSSERIQIIVLQWTSHPWKSPQGRGLVPYHGL